MHVAVSNSFGFGGSNTSLVLPRLNEPWKLDAATGIGRDRSSAMKRIMIALASTGFILIGAAAAQERRATDPLALKIVGTQLLNSAGDPVRLRGVNTASMEWTADGEGHILSTVQTAIRDWHVNTIRLPLSQDRWFGKAPGQEDGGKFYRILVRQIVDAVRAADATSSSTCTGRTRASGARTSVSIICLTRTA